MSATRPEADPVDAASELHEACLEAVDPYPGATSIPFRVRCLRRDCPAQGEQFETYLSVVRVRRDNDEPACSHCCGQERARHRRSERYDEEVAQAIAHAWGYAPDFSTRFSNDATKWPGFCLAEFHPCDPVLNSRFHSGPCASCADHGFKPDPPALVHLSVNPRIRAAKISICEDHPRDTCLDEHRRNGWTVVQTERFEIGTDARAVEELVLRAWWAARHSPVVKNGGYRETTSTAHRAIDEISKEMREIIGAVRRHAC